MKCQLCGNAWEGANQDNYCPQCGAPTRTDRRTWPWRAILLMVLGALGIWLFVTVVPLSGSRKLSNAEKVQLAGIETEIAQVEDQLRQCPVRQQALLRQIGEEGNRPAFDLSKNKELAQEFEEFTRMEGQLTEQRIELERKRQAILKSKRPER